MKDLPSPSAAPDGFTARLVPRFPTAQPTSQACAEPAAPVQSSRAGAAFHHFTETCPLDAADGKVEAAPEGSGAVALSITVSAAVALILKLAGDATGLAADEIIARGICTYADRIGLPALARPAADDVGDDIGDVPHFVRRDQTRFSSAREALGNRTQGMRE